MKTTKKDEFVTRNTVPLFAWEFHYEYLNDLKAEFADLRKLEQISNQFFWKEENIEFKERIKQEVILVTDADLKIVFASSGIKRMTGYAESEILGKTPKFFQGPETSQTVINEIRQAIDLQIPFEETIQNYKKDGKSYSCKISAFPVFNLKGKLSHFVAFEREVFSFGSSFQQH